MTKQRTIKKKSIALAITGALTIGTTAIAEDITLRMATVDATRPAAKTMAAFAKIVSSNVDGLNVDVFEGGIGTLDMMALGRSVVHMSMVTPVAFDLMSRAEAMFVQESVAGELSKTVQLIMWYPYGSYRFAVRADSPAQTLDDLAGLSVYLGPHALSGPFHDVTNWIKATTGLTTGTDYDAVVDAWAAGADAFRRGDVDVFVSACLQPCILFDNLATQIDLKFLGSANSKTPAIDAFFAAGRDPANSVEPDKPPVASFATAVGIAVYADVDAQSVYEMTKTYWENQDQIPETHLWADSITAEYAATNRSGITLHSGAARYYREIGLLD